MGYPQFQGFYPPYGQRFGPPPAFPPGAGIAPYGVPPAWFSSGQGFPQPLGQFPGQAPPIGPFGQQHQQPQPQPQPPRVNAYAPSPVGAPKTAAELPIGDKAAQIKPGGVVASPPAAAAAAAAAAPASQGGGDGGGPPPPVETKPSVTEVAQSSEVKDGPAPPKAVPTGPKSDRIPPAIPIVKPTNGTGPSASAQSAVMTDATRAATAAVAAAMAKLPQPDGGQQQRDVDIATRKMGEFRPFENRPQRGGFGGYRGGGRGGGYYRNYQYQGANSKKLEVPTTDYDFESANAKFNKQDLVKEAIASGSPLAEGGEEGGGAPNETFDTVEHSSVSSQGPPNNVAGYNKSSSFFDNISSEARDREEGGGPNREWRGEEEKRNIETFGQGSVDGYRSSFRGRGRGRGFRGRGFRGRGFGYNRGYGGRGRGASQSTGVPT